MQRLRTTTRTVHVLLGRVMSQVDANANRRIQVWRAGDTPGHLIFERDNDDSLKPHRHDYFVNKRVSVHALWSRPGPPIA